MKKGTTFLWKAVLIVATLVAVDQGLGALLAHYYFRMPYGEQARLTYIADSTTTPVLILGSSRAEHGYIPGIVSDSLHLGCYNAGKDQQGLCYDLALEKMALLRYRPRLIILDLTPVSFALTGSGLSALDVLLPYYRQHPEIRPILDKTSSWERVKTLSKLYCYNSLVLQIAKNTIRPHEDDSIASGYNPKFSSLSPIPDPGFARKDLIEPADTTCVAAFREIIATAKRYDCPLAVTVGPVYYRLSTVSNTISLAHRICNEQQVPFFDYTASPAFIGRPDLFYDPKHLNDAGAQRFTRLLCSDLIAKGFH